MTASERIHEENWQLHAACHGMDSNLFIPDLNAGDGRKAKRIYEAAKQVCATCPVTAECLAFAMSFEGRSRVSVRQGVYGGKTPAERTAISRGAK